MTAKNNQIMELHPLCTYFPRMSEDEFNSLKDNIQHNGQTHPIYALDGMILDGGNRYRALCELGIAPIIIEYTGSNPTQPVVKFTSQAFNTRSICGHRIGFPKLGQSSCSR